MFGDGPIVGEKYVSILKNRMVLPAFTNAEVGEHVQAQFVTTYNEKDNINEIHHLNIYSVYDFNKRMSDIEEALRDAYASMRINYTQFNNYRRYFYGHLSFMPEEVDMQKRIHLEPRIITNLKINKLAFVVGIKNHLELYPNYETYSSCLKELYMPCSEFEAFLLLKEQKFIKNSVKLLIDRPIVDSFLCVFRVPEVLLLHSKKDNYYDVDIDNMSFTFLDEIINKDKSIYKKEGIFPVKML